MEQEKQVRRRRRRERAKTWSRLGNLGRVPTEYEIVTHGMNHTATSDGRLPLEMGESRQGNQWLLKYRNGVPLQAENWDGFRDPDQVTYRLYNRMQDDNETFVDQVLEEYAENRETDRDLSSEWLDALGHLLTPQRYPVHGLQMLATYTAQMAPTSYVANCASFQASDELRRVQRIAYRTKQLQLLYPERGYGERERGIWQEREGWQGVRKAVERALVAYAWDESFVASHLVLKPLYDELFLRELAEAARAQDDDLDSLILDNLYKDSLRSRRWTSAFARFCIEQRAENRAVLAGYASDWESLGEELLTSAAGMLAAHGQDDAEAIAGRCREAVQALHRDAGLVEA